MRQTKLSLLLLLIFLASAALNWILCVHFRNVMSSGDQSKLLDTVFQIHVAFVTMTAGGIFAKRDAKETARREVSFAALCIALLWSGIVVSSWLGFPGFNVVGQNDEKGLIDQLNHNASLVSFLVGPMLAFLFGSRQAVSASI